MKFLVRNYSCHHNPRLGGQPSPDPLSVCPLSPTEFVELPPPHPNKVPRYATGTNPRTQAVPPTNECSFRRSHHNVTRYKLHRNPPYQHTNNSAAIFLRPKPRRLVQSACSLADRHCSYRLSLRGYCGSGPYVCNPSTARGLARV